MQGFYPALQRTFSATRLHAYHDGEPDPPKLDITARYAHNMDVAMRLSPALHVLEVSLRNAMHNAFSAKYGTGRWYERAALLGHKQIGQIAVARTNLHKAQKTETPDRLIAELTMGFWVGLFGGYYEPY
ncbi:hypothetical protein J5T34_18115 [Cupriavidus gilardii]|uniref:hypothetical protein n=1 Tax=Cupriavidus gilardii TaxID=82541 RepID=UPI001ABEC7A1|nr:hypothetical protein [Cupriavidus gilardii]MBO4122647.1 hypothetical protein [Cupriavidus gilardii]